MLYLPPARVRDFDRSPRRDALYQAWHDRVAAQIASYSDLPRFLDPLDPGEGAVPAAIPWSGFPRLLDAWLDVETDPTRIDRAHRSAELLDRYAYVSIVGDPRFFRVPFDPANGLALYPEVDGAPAFAQPFAITERPQDEYLEWHVVRDPNTGRVTRIDYTCEPPEYWESLAEGDEELAATLYSELLRTPVPKEDLFFHGDVLCPRLERLANGFRVVDHVPLFPGDPDFRRGQYNRWNRWNTELGAVHLTQAANTLFAEINLAARATQRFAARPDLTTDVDRFTLVACGGYGAINRNSDPTIGFEVNSLALSGFRVMVSNPIGLYVSEVDLRTFRDPEGKPVPQERILTVHRGTFSDEDGLARVLRFSIHPPEGADYGLEACTVDGHPLTTGGPVARRTAVTIHGVAVPDDGSEPPLVGCGAVPCAHPSKRPRYFVASAPGGTCPPPADPVWQEPPVALAPELTGLTPLVRGPRAAGQRTT